MGQIDEAGELGRGCRQLHHVFDFDVFAFGRRGRVVLDDRQQVVVQRRGGHAKGKVTEDLEFYSVMRSIRAIEESDVCILMLDAQQGLESQDLNIHNLIVRNRKGCVIVVNKWDLVEKGNNTMKEWKEALAKKLAPFNDIPIIFTSVLNKQRILEVLQTAIRVYENRKRRVATCK